MITNPTVILVLAGILWSFSGILIKSIALNALAIAGVRSAIGAILQIGYFKATGSGQTFGKNKLQWFGAACLSANTIALVNAFQMTKAANAVFLHFGGVLLVAFLSGPILHEKPTRKDWLVVTVAIIGMFLLVGDTFESRALTGNLIGVFCGITMALSTICLRAQAKVGQSALEQVLLANLMTAAIGLPFLTISLPHSLHEWWLLLVLGVVPWGLPDILYCNAITKVRALRALLLCFLDPVLTAVWPFIFMAEAPSTPAMIGAAIVSIAIFYREYTPGGTPEETA